ncbi:bifunctional 2-polyprenyl-6-hydroxyphenol methylase/3-demethylubiquinol 3-O-methyltransferase UbiG [Sulfuricurvum sp.]|uniref:class I SAM-dependent methyltransferase n=1 Tax=Sulfuricurvum sp. TaxID=2025608 RepID=UPI002606E06D|nr:class I SAM-dependent methyltransferase [Sulfuricurvum sp.]MDD4950524.1 class I SAM-dependent methyltransferase [Sulfuricurvum sp.]
MSSQTQQFYENNSYDLIKRYDTADMSDLHQLLTHHIPFKSKIIDIGFGSGRDLAFLNSQGFEIYGMDPVEVFVVQAQHRFPDIREHFEVGSFISNDLPFEWLTSFDAVISIAVWMHLKAAERSKAIEFIQSLLKQDGLIILSFSLGCRESDDGRHFEPLELQEVIQEFSDSGFTVIESICTNDSLGRDSIEWATVVFKR